MSTKQSAQVSVVLTSPDKTKSIAIPGVFDTMSGGDVKADVKKHRPGGLGKEDIYGALRTFEDIKLGRVMSDADDELVNGRLINLAGKWDATVTKQRLDVDGVAVRAAVVWNGKISDIQTGDYDSNSSDVLMWEMTISVRDRA